MIKSAHDQMNIMMLKSAKCFAAAISLHANVHHIDTYVNIHIFVSICACIRAIDPFTLWSQRDPDHRNSTVSYIPLESIHLWRIVYQYESPSKLCKKRFIHMFALCRNRGFLSNVKSSKKCFMARKARCNSESMIVIYSYPELRPKKVTKSV